MQRQGHFPACYDIDDLSHKEKRGVSPLDPNHTHFILVDGGSEGQFGKEIQFRAEFEKYLSAKMKMVNKNNSKQRFPSVELLPLLLHVHVHHAFSVFAMSEAQVDGRICSAVLLCVEVLRCRWYRWCWREEKTH